MYEIHKGLKVLILQSLPSFGVDPEMAGEIESTIAGASVKVRDRRDLSPGDPDLKEAEVIFGWPSKEQLSGAERLKWLHLPSAGVDSYADRSIYRQMDIILTNSSGAYGISIAEHVMALMLAFCRNLHVHVSSRGKWVRPDSAREFCGSTVGIIGLGDIGGKVAVRSAAMGARVIAVKRNPGKVPEYIDALYGEDGIEQLLRQSDFVVLSLPDTPRTRGILSRERIALMKKEAYVINVGRGTAIDQDALIEALEEKRLAGAGLDVTTPEPLPEDNPLWKMPNVIITSHSSGMSPLNSQRCFRIFHDNLKSYAAGEPLSNRVDFDAGY